MDRQRSEARIAEVIAEMSVDVVALQELDLGRRRSAGANQTKMIAEQLGWYSHFHPAMRRDDEHYGNAILSRYQLNFRRAVELPGRPPFFCRENRAAIEANIETNLGKVHIINTHLGLGWRERFVQAQLFTGAEWRGAIARARNRLPRHIPPMNVDSNTAIETADAPMTSSSNWNQTIS